MPIRPENRARYPADWPDIRARIRERSGNRCECTGQCGRVHPRMRAGEYIDQTPRCNAWNGMPIDDIEGPKIVLTTAHLGLPAKLPFDLHVAGYAVTDEVVELVGFLVPINTERLEWRLMMNNRATSELLRGPPASGAGFLVALPGGAASLLPCGTVVSDAAPGPILVQLSTWSLRSKPLETTSITAEAPARPDMESTDLDGGTAAFAGQLPEPAFGNAYEFVATGRRASLDAIRGLLRCDWRDIAADNALDVSRRSSGHSHGSLYHMDDYPDNRDENLLHACQGCHNRYDAPVRAAGIKARRRALCAAGDLFCEEIM